MKNTERQKLLISILFFTFLTGLFFYPSQSEAKTTVTVEGCDITITVYLAFAFLDDVSWMNAQQFVDIWVDGMLEVWNEPDFTYGFCECPVHFEVVVDLLPKGKNCFDAQKDLPDYHCIHVVNEPINQRGNVADATQSSSQYPNSYGEWTSQATGMNAAHEVGHMMGLGEEYHRDQNGNYVNDNPQQGSAQSIMAQTWGEVGALQEHINSVISGAGVNCPIPECCCGNGDQETALGEECDYKADPTSCPEGQICDTSCKCKSLPKVTPICGDGYITPPKEECEPKSKPIGCQLDEECIGCKCEKKQEPKQPPETPITQKDDPISITPDFLNFIPGITESFFTVSNASQEIVSWEILSDFPEWLDTFPVIGEVMPEGEIMVWVNIDRCEIPDGVYEHNISLNSNSGDKQILIRMTIGGDISLQ